MRKEGPIPKESPVRINLAVEAQGSMAKAKERKLDTRNIIIAHSKEIFNGSYKLENLLTDSKKFKSLSALTSFLTSNFTTYDLKKIIGTIQQNEAFMSKNRT
ncbi:MAG: hypothetical protein WC794_00070 [Candidatus Doudnabacteria bacterium]|jgi:hypothetical protein